MNRIAIILAFVLLAALVADAAADPNKCVDTDRKITYTNLPCPEGQKATRVENTVSVLDASEQRALAARQAAGAGGTGGASAAADVSDIPTGGTSPSNLVKIQDARSMLETALAAREYLVMSGAMLLAGGVALLGFRRRKANAPINPYATAYGNKETGEGSKE